MATIIQDGGGSGYRANVSTVNRLCVDAVNKSVSDDAARLGNAYNINTGSVNLTSANLSAVLYVENIDPTKDLIVENIIYIIGNSTAGSGDLVVSVYRNPTAGTIISGATPVEMEINRNFGSANTLTVNAYAGAEGNTLTGGDKIIETIFNQSPARASLNAGSIVIPNGTSIGFVITPATSNTSLNVEIALSVHVENV